MVKYLSLTEIETVKVRSPKTSSNTLINFVSGENFSWDMDRIWEYLSVMETSDLYEAERGATGDKLQEIYIYWLYQTIRRTQFVTKQWVEHLHFECIYQYQCFYLWCCLYLLCRGLYHNADRRQSMSWDMYFVAVGVSGLRLCGVMCLQVQCDLHVWNWLQQQFIYLKLDGINIKLLVCLSIEKPETIPCGQVFILRFSGRMRGSGFTVCYYV